MQTNDPSISKDVDADALVALLDHLCKAGSQHINLDIGEQTRVQTVNTSDCNPRLGACAIPNFGDVPEENDEEL